MIITLAGNNPDVDSSNIFFAGDSDFGDEYELTGTTNTVAVEVRDGDNDYQMQRNSGRAGYMGLRMLISLSTKERDYLPI